jgi:hypothetical protein
MQRKLARCLGTAVVFALGVTCSDSAIVTPPAEVKHPATSIRLVSSTPSGIVGDTLRERIRLFVGDVSGRPVAGAVVRFAPRDPANPQIADATSDSAGIVSVNVRLDTIVGRQRMSANPLIGFVPGALGTFFELDATPGPPARISAPTWGCCHPAIAGASIATPSFIVQDQYGNSVPNTPVRFRVEPSGFVKDATLNTTFDGVTPSTTWTLGNAIGEYRLIAEVGTLSATVSASVVSGAPVRIVILSGDRQQVALGAIVPKPIDVAVHDSAGRNVPNVFVNWTDEATGAVICTFGTSRLSPEFCPWRLGTQPGVYTLRVSAGGVVGRVTATAMGRPSAMRILSSTTTMSYPVGSQPTDDVVAQLRFADGTPAVGYWIDALPVNLVGEVLLNVVDGVLRRDSVLTGTDGIVRFRWRLPEFVGTDSLRLQVRAYPDIAASIAAHVTGPLRFSSIGAGAAHTCGSVRFFTDDPQPPIYCWGRNTDGQLGDGTTTSRSVPRQSLANAIYYTMPPALGRGQTCAAFEGPTRYLSYGPTGFFCWGDNRVGQLGAPSAAVGKPVALHSSEGLRLPVAGASHSCAVLLGSYSIRQYNGLRHIATMCWGDNRFGQLGDGTTISRSEPTSVNGVLFPVPDGGGNAVGALAAGDDFTCATNSALRAACWGRNADGQLGDGTTTDRALPVKVALDANVIALVAGGSHACAILVDNAVHCWGKNDRGQLGDGTTTSRTSPVQIGGSLRFTKLAAGRAHTCGIATTGLTYCWGDNSRGQLGNGVSGNITAAPTLVTGGLAFAQITAGGSHTCGLLAGGRQTAAYCWGANNEGQLGDGTTTDRLVPTGVLPFQP